MFFKTSHKRPFLGWFYGRYRKEKIKMKKIIFIWVLIFLSLITCFAQKTETKLNISGKWSFDEKSSRVSPLFQTPEEYTLDITQTDIEVKMEMKLVQKGRTSKAEAVLYLDGRGEINGKIESKTVLKGNAIIRKKTSKHSGPDEKYSLSKDGKKLTFVRSVYDDGTATFPVEYFVFKK